MQNAKCIMQNCRPAQFFPANDPILAFQNFVWRYGLTIDEMEIATSSFASHRIPAAVFWSTLPESQRFTTGLAKVLPLSFEFRGEGLFGSCETYPTISWEIGVKNLKAAAEALEVPFCNFHSPFCTSALHLGSWQTSNALALQASLCGSVTHRLHPPSPAPFWRAKAATPKHGVRRQP